MSFVKTTAQTKIIKLKKRVRVVQGGTSASKTFTILPLLISYALSKPNLSISVVSETFPHLRKGAIRDFKNIMISTSNYNPANWLSSNATYTFTNGSYIEFFSADHPDRLRGARRDILFVNEANNIKFEAWQQLIIRTRLFAYVDFNPSHEFWAHTELENEPDTDWLTLTYKDNEATPKEVVKELQRAEKKAEKSEYWRNWVDVYVYGKLGSRSGVIFKEHQSWNRISTIPKNARLLGYGLDFGYTNDPTSCIAVYKLNDAYIFDEVFYNTLLTNEDIANRLKRNNLDKIMGWADSAEPKSIDYLKAAGCRVGGVTKGADSIRFGLALMGENLFYVTDRSLNTIKELREYSYKVTEEGKTVNEPEKNQRDHAIDAARYFVMMDSKRSASELVFV